MMLNLLFANLDALRLVLASGAAPCELTAAQARAGFDPHGRLWLQTDLDLGRNTIASFTRLGIQILGGDADVALRAISCWFELIPAARSDSAIAPGAAIVFVTPSVDAARIVAEIKRISPGSKVVMQVSESRAEALLRVKPCPTFTLLRADGTTANATTAFIEQARRVYVETGFEHPMAQLVRPPDQQIALVSGSGQWTWLPENPFMEEIDVFHLGTVALRLRDTDWPTEVEMPLRLIESRSSDEPELWLIRERPHEQLESLARQSGQVCVERFRAATIEWDGKPIVLLWANQSKVGSPIVSISGEAFRSYLKIPDLFVPCGFRLSPPLRREVVRRICPDGTGHLTLIMPASKGGFTIVRVRHTDFAPLASAVEFSLEQSRQPLEPIAPRSVLDWEALAVEEPPMKPLVVPPTRRLPRPANPPPLKRPGLMTQLRNWWRPRRTKPKLNPEITVREAPADGLISPFPESAGRHTDLLVRRTKLESQFLEGLRTPDPAERVALFPELAGTNAQLGHLSDAAACWLTAIWQHPTPPRYWLWSWLQVEIKLGRVAFDEQDVRMLVEATPSPSSIRTLAAIVVWLAGLEAIPQTLIDHAGTIRSLLETHEKWLPIRAAWLAQLNLTKVSGMDSLALARTHDRLGERLFQQGLSIELDLPSFLRFSRRSARGRFPAVRDWLFRLRDSVHRWIDGHVRQRPAQYCANGADGFPDQDGSGTKALADFMLAWGLARLGEATSARHLAQPAHRSLTRQADPVFEFLGRAFEARLAEALGDKSTDSALPKELLDHLEHFVPTPTDDRPLLTRYRIDSLRQHSRILEPSGSTNPYRGSAPLAFEADWRRTIEDPSRIGSSIDRLMASPRASGDRVEALGAALALAPFLGAAFARELLTRFSALVDRVHDAGPRIMLTGSAIATAAQFDLVDSGQKLLDLLSELFESDDGAFPLLARQMLQSWATNRRYGPDDLHRLESLAGQCLLAIRDLGFGEDIARFRVRAIEWILRGEPLGNLRRVQPDTWLPALRAMLHLSAGSPEVRDDEQAALLLDAARQCLLYTELPPPEKGPMACAYAAALGRAPIRVAQGRLEELFRDLTGLYDTRQTNSHFALTPLRLIDAVVRALVGDEFALGTGVRRWLAEDEFLVRRRMLRDLQELLGSSACVQAQAASE